MRISRALGIILGLLSLAALAKHYSPDWRDQLKSVGSRDKVKYAWRGSNFTGKRPVIKGSNSTSRYGRKSGATTVPKGRPGSGTGTVGSDPTMFVWAGLRSHVASPEEAAALRAQLRERTAPIATAWSLVRAGRLSEARSVLVPLLQDEDRREPAASILAEVALRQGNFSESLAILATCLAAIRNPDDCLTAAVAGAMTGNVFPGQIDFCKNIIYQKSGGDQGFAQFAIPSGNGPIASKASALLAYASQVNSDAVARQFFEQALTYAPHNAWANWSLGRLYLAARNYQAAENCFHIAAQYSTGDLQRIAKQDETDANYLRTNGG